MPLGEANYIRPFRGRRWLILYEPGRGCLTPAAAIYAISLAIAHPAAAASPPTAAVRQALLCTTATRFRP